MAEDTNKAKEEKNETGEKDRKEPSAEPEKKDTGEAAEGKTEAGVVEGEQVDSAEDLKRQLDSMSDRYLRLMAEFDNFKKRVSRDYERLVESANERLIGELIEVRENFERALKTIDNIEAKSDFSNGVKLIYGKFDDILKTNGLECFGEKGDAFDPQIHDALMKTASESVPEDHIAEVYERGYRLKNKVIKHAKVVVSGGKAQEPNTGEKKE